MHTYSSKIILLLTLIITVQHIIASDYMNYNMPSAQVADMFRYGNVETSLFTGRLNLSIPLYDLDDPDFTFNMALHYNSEGFKPRKHSGYVGYSWFLEAGGCITREVRNYADETCRTAYPSGMDMMGMLFFLRRNQLDKDSVFVLGNSIGMCCTSMCSWNLGQNCSRDVDYLPDIFHFNFCGYQGSFMIDNKGNPIILNGDFMKIDSLTLDSQFSAHPSNNEVKPLKCTTITLTSKDGYKYVFGGDISSVGYTVSLRDNNNWSVQYPPIINTWYLKRIIAPNQREMVFHYKPLMDENGLNRRDPLLELNEYYDMFAQQRYFVDTINILHNRRDIKFNMTKICVLDSIVLSGAQPLCVQFFNRADSLSLYNHSGHYGFGDRPYLLDSVNILSDNHILKKIRLSYEYQSYNYRYGTNAHYWRFLKNVFISGEGAYTLFYNHAVGTYQSLLADNEESFYQTVDYYGFGKGNALGGMLSRIDFPTGGKQEFTYETHLYGKERRYVAADSRNVTMETIVPSGQNILGVRIQTVKTYSGADLVETKQYSYLPAPNTTFTGSSGLYYNNQLVYLPENNDGLLVTDANAYCTLDTHIGYAYVEETTKDATNNVLSKIGYTFDVGADTYSTLSNQDIRRRDSCNNNCPQVSDIDVHAAFSGMLAYNSKLTKVGHLLAKDYFRGEHIIRSELYCYNNIDSSPIHLVPAGKGELGSTDTIVIFSHCVLPITRRLYVYPDVVTQWITQDYDENNYPMYKNRSYLYDKKLRIKKEYIRDRQYEWLFTRYTYPDEYAISSLPHVRDIPTSINPLYQLRQQHRINVPLEIISGYEDVNFHEYVTGGKLNLYTSAYKFLPIDSATSYVYLSRTMELALDNPITDYQPLEFTYTSPIFDSRYKVTCDYTFDANLRLKSIAPYGKMPTSYTWNGIYPISKTIGNQISTYTFIPYVGISSYTNERGVTTYYTYDSNGKLTEVYQLNDGRKEILNSYLYHIKTE